MHQSLLPVLIDESVRSVLRLGVRLPVTLSAQDLRQQVVLERLRRLNAKKPKEPKDPIPVDQSTRITRRWIKARIWDHLWREWGGSSTLRRVLQKKRLLTRELRRPPTLEELAASADLSVSKLQEILNSRPQFVSDAILRMTPLMIERPDDYLARPPHEREILVQYHWEGKTLRDISADTGRSIPDVIQILLMVEIDNDQSTRAHMDEDSKARVRDTLRRMPSSGYREMLFRYYFEKNHLQDIAVSMKRSSKEAAKAAIDRARDNFEKTYCTIFIHDYFRLVIDTIKKLSIDGYAYDNIYRLRKALIMMEYNHRVMIIGIYHTKLPKKNIVTILSISPQDVDQLLREAEQQFKALYHRAV